MSAGAPENGDLLRSWLDRVAKAETTQWLMVVLAAEAGASAADLAAWYGLEEDEIQSWLDERSSQPLAVSIAEREGINFDAIADKSGLGRTTIVDWFGALDNQSVDRAADIIRRYSQRSPGPLLSGTDCRVHYVNAEALAEHGWEITDDDLFEKAAAAHLDSSQYGRFLVRSGETILEAAEGRGISWPYACRGGACANCAVIVLEGDIAMPGQTILTEHQVQVMNARLTCVGVPVTEELRLVMNVQHLDQFKDLRLPSPMTESTPAI